MTQGRTPIAAISTILCLMCVGSGRPLIKTPPSWFILPCPFVQTSKSVKFQKRLPSSGNGEGRNCGMFGGVADCIAL